MTKQCLIAKCRYPGPVWGFTLAELLIALVIIGEIATFTIPKILTGQATSRNNAIAKETLATLAGAYQQLQMNSGGVPFSTTPGALTQYMNYTRTDTSSTIDLDPYEAPIMPPGTLACSASYPCMKLHNGGTLMLLNNASFGSASGFIYGILDPDGNPTGKADSIVLCIYYNGRATTFGNIMATSSYDPTWFSL